MRRELFLTASLLGALGLSQVGCDRTKNPVAPAGSVLTITTSASKIGLSGTAELTVTGFRNDGKRLPQGTQIRLETTLGTLSAGVVEIGGDGLARASLSADGKAGDATVTARLTTGDTEASISIEISENKPTLLLTVNPSVINVLETAAVTIIARDENNLPLGAGESISLTSNAGTFRQKGTVSTVTSVQTESNGTAEVEFVAGSRAITAGDVCGTLRNSDETCETIQVLDAPVSFTFTINKDTVSQTDNTLTLRATVVNTDGLALSGVLVRFDSEVGGDFDPSTSVTTDTSGQAVATITYKASDLVSGTRFDVFATVRIADQDVTQSKSIRVQ